MTTIEQLPGRALLVRWVDFARKLALPWLLIAVIAGTAGLTYTLNNLSINTSTSDMLSEELLFRRNETALQDAFPQLSNTLSIIVEAESAELAEDAAEQLVAALASRDQLFRSLFYPEMDPFFRQNGLLYLDVEALQDLSDRLAEAQPMLASLNEDPSLRGLAAMLRLAIEEAEAETAAAVAPALDKIAAVVERVAEGRPARLSWRALMTGEDKADPESRRRFIVAQPVLDYASLEPAAKPIQAIKDAAQRLDLTEDRGITVRITGLPAMRDDELRSLRDGMGLVGLLSTVFVLSLLAIGLRSVRLVVATLLTLVLGLILTGTFATLVIGAFNLISVAFAVLFLGLSVDFGIHFCLRYKEAIDGGDDHAGALAVAAGGVGRALTLSAVAAAIGFLSFLPTSYRGVSELGLISGAGMMIALFANLTLLPALLSLMPLSAAASSSGAGRAGPGLGQAVQDVVERHGRAVIAAAALLAVAAAATLPFVSFDDDPLNLRDPDSESVATLLDLIDDSRVKLYNASVLTDDLESAEALADRLAALPAVDYAITALDYVPGAQDDKLDIIDEMAFFLGPLLLPVEPLPAPSDAERQRAVQDLRGILDKAAGPLEAGAARLAAALDRLEPAPAVYADLEQALLAGLPKRLDFLTASLEAEPVTLADLPPALRDRKLAPDGHAIVEVKPVEALRDSQSRRDFVAALRTVAPGVTGAPVSIMEAGQAVIGAFQEAALYAFVLIVGLLLIVLRSLRDSAMILAPLLLSALLTGAVTVVLGVPFNFANIIVLPLLLGLGVAFGIQIVLRQRSEAAGRLMQTSTPRAVVFSGLTTIGSFCALALSSHPGTASMGLLLAVAITLTMACTLIVLPALLAVTGRGDSGPPPAP